MGFEISGLRNEMKNNIRASETTLSLKVRNYEKEFSAIFLKHRPFNQLLNESK